MKFLRCKNRKKNEVRAKFASSKKAANLQKLAALMLSNNLYYCVLEFYLRQISQH